MFLLHLYKDRGLLFQLTLRDFKARYLGSFLGLLWAVIQPLFTILVFWFVFQVGFKSKPVDNFPFILWLICGIIPWFFISECIAAGTESITTNAYLVKKVVFRVSTLPIVKLLSALLVHLFFIGIIFSSFAIYGYRPTLYCLQLLFYLPMLIIFLLGIIWMTASVVIFIKDIQHVIALILQFGFWLTPIFWSASMVPEKYQFFLKINPFFHFIRGYRDAFINDIWFWQRPLATSYILLLCLVSFIGGAVVFTRLRPHFADVI